MKLIVTLLSCAGVCTAADRLGQPFTLHEPVTVARVDAQPEKFVGRTVQVKGKVTEVCQMAGCWMALADEQNGRVLRVKVEDGDIVFPQSAVGRLAIAEGKLEKLQLTKEQAIARARHEAAENGKPFRPESMKAGMTFYQLRGSGAVLLD